MIVRDATPDDAERCAEIYAPYVRDTAVSFETEVPTAAEIRQRIADAQRGHAWLVLEDDGRVVGYAYGGPFMTRPDYGWACTVSVYVEPGRRRTGGGRALYEGLLARLAGRGLREAMAGIALPNDPSVGLHRALGFAEVGTYRRVGWKLGRWHDVVWFQRSLSDDDGPPTGQR